MRSCGSDGGPPTRWNMRQWVSSCASSRVTCTRRICAARTGSCSALAGTGHQRGSQSSTWLRRAHAEMPGSGRPTACSSSQCEFTTVIVTGSWSPPQRPSALAASGAAPFRRSSVDAFHSTKSSRIGPGSLTTVPGVGLRIVAQLAGEHSERRGRRQEFPRATHPRAPAISPATSATVSGAVPSSGGKDSSATGARVWFRIREILDVAVVAAHQHPRIRRPPAEHRPGEGVELLQLRLGQRHVPGVPRLVGEEVLEQGEVRALRRAPEDVRRLVRGAQRHVEAPRPAARARQVVRQRLAGPHLVQRPQRDVPCGEGEGGRGGTQPAAGAFGDLHLGRARRHVRETERREVRARVSVHEGRPPTRGHQPLHHRGAEEDLPERRVRKAEDVPAHQLRRRLTGQDGGLVGRGLRPSGNPERRLEQGERAARQPGAAPVLELRQEPLTARERVEVRNPGHQPRRRR